MVVDMGGPPSRGPPDQPGIVDKDVDRAEPVEGAAARQRVGEVERQRLGAAAAGLDPGDRRVGGRPPGADHRCARGAERHGDRLPDAGVGAGDERPPPLKRERVHLSVSIATMSTSR
jgi:hypothetical protein